MALGYQSAASFHFHVGENNDELMTTPNLGKLRVQQAEGSDHAGYITFDVCFCAQPGVRLLGISKLISNHCADYGLQDYGLHWVQVRRQMEDCGLRGGGGWSGLC